jgi:diketogulonate reductase-like aldo/keto reductase
MRIETRIELNNGAGLPALGFGTWQLGGERAKAAVGEAIEVGYRHIDTAMIYRNEADVGAAVLESNVPREDIWVTTKLWGSDQPKAEKALDASLKRLGLDYIDLYLVHWPVDGLIADTWKRMEELCATGKAKSVGVSNHSQTQLSRILENCTLTPAVNQIPISPFGFEQELIDFCHDNKIAVEAYSPLNKGHTLTDTLLTEIAAAISQSPAQVMLRWAVQKDTVPLPKSGNAARIRENAEIFDFELTEAEMEQLDSLNIY